MVNPDPGLYGSDATDIRNSHLDTLAGSVEDRLKINPMFSLIGGVRFEDFQLLARWRQLRRLVPAGQPFTANWTPVSYRAAYTFEPVKGLMFYSMYATAYDPAAAGIFSISPGNSLALTSARIYETGVKQSVLGQPRGVDVRRLRYHPKQRLCCDQRDGVGAGRRNPHQGHRDWRAR